LAYAIIPQEIKPATPNAAIIGTAKMRLLLRNPPKISDKNVVGSKVAAETKLVVDAVAVVASHTSRGVAFKSVGEDEEDATTVCCANLLLFARQEVGAKALAIKAMLLSKQTSRYLWMQVIVMDNFFVSGKRSSSILYFLFFLPKVFFSFVVILYYTS